MRIVISGTPGSGKSTVAKLVAAKLKLRYYSMGELQRRYAKGRRVSIAQLMRMAESYPQMDREIDAMLRELGAREDNFVIDSRLGAFFIPHATLKVFLDAEPAIRAERIWQAQRDEERAESAAAALKVMEGRDASDERRFAQLYAISYRDPKLYDRIMDTGARTAAAVAQEIVQLAGGATPARRSRAARGRSRS